MLDAVRAGTPLSAKEKAIHDKGLVSILRQLHDDLDAAVLEAYGWSDLKAGTVSPSGPANESSMNRSGPREDKGDSNLTSCAGPPGGRFLPIDELLARLVALNHVRAAETPRRRNTAPPKHRTAETPRRRNTAPPKHRAAETPRHRNTAPPKHRAAETPATWPATLSAQVTAIQKLLPTHAPNPETLSAHFGRKSPKRAQQIAEILETLQGLGKL